MKCEQIASLAVTAAASPALEKQGFSAVVFISGNTANGAIMIY